LAKIEGTAATIINRILDNDITINSPSHDSVSLLTFIISLWSRTPAAARELNELATQTGRALLKSHPKIPEELKKQIDHVRINLTEPIGASLGLAAKNIRYLLDLELVVIKNESETEFITSDAPVIFFNQWCQDVTGRGTIGFLQSGLQIILPLSPRFLVLLYDRSVYKVGTRKENLVVVKREDDVTQINTLQLLTAEENLFYSGAPDTKNQITKLPIAKRRTRADALVTRRAIGVSDDSVLIHSAAKPPSIKLDVSFIKVVRRKRRIPLNERIFNHRDAAEALYEYLEGPRKTRYKKPPVQGPWKIIDE